MLQPVRFSAVEMFGVPLDRPALADDMSYLVDLMGQYDIEPAEIPTEVTDFTPYYGTNSQWKYFVHKDEAGVAVVELLPRFDDSALARVGKTALGDGLLIEEETSRTVRVPTEKPGVALAGRGPRFPGKICVHELITAI